MIPIPVIGKFCCDHVTESEVNDTFPVPSLPQCEQSPALMTKLQSANNRACSAETPLRRVSVCVCVVDPLRDKHTQVSQVSCILWQFWFQDSRPAGDGDGIEMVRKIGLSFASISKPIASPNFKIVLELTSSVPK